MKRYSTVVLMVALLGIALSCSHNGDGAEDMAVTPVVSEVNSIDSEVNPPNLSYNPDDYEIVVIDIDRWKIMLNHNRIRQNVVSYEGCMYYRAGVREIWGRAAAMYNPEWDLLTITAQDAGMDRGIIIYSLKFEEATGTDMEGTFVYYEFPRRTNWVDAWLDKGNIGLHFAGTGSSAPPGLGKKASDGKHPKIDR